MVDLLLRRLIHLIALSYFSLLIWLAPTADSMGPQCGGLDHAAITRPCLRNDTYCGEWRPNKRYVSTAPNGYPYVWKPHGCQYRDVTPAQARKCLGSRAVACMGDSIVRDLCQAVIRFLLEMPDAPQMHKQGKFNHHYTFMYGTRIEDVPWWKRNIPAFNYNGYLYPQPFNATYSSHKWQIQQWNLFHHVHSKSTQVEDVLQNKMVNVTQGIRPIDFMLWSVGLHDFGWFMNPPRGEKFLKDIINKYYMPRLKIMKFPVVWMPMNRNCGRKLIQKYLDRDQPGMVDEANVYQNRMFLEKGLPYWDADAVMRNARTCELSSDGVHVHMFVDNIRAKMLFNHLCDSDWNWRENILDYFIRH
jgi:hypothetical protein